MPMLPSTSSSPQGLAALSMGNPAALQRRVMQSPKDPQTGLPQDLVAALALSIVSNEQNAVKRDEAMKQLQQAAGPTGQMPTVVQSLQQAAMQKLQTQPQAQPQGQPAQEAPQQTAGLAEAPVEFGMAGGGLVSFAEGKTVPKAKDEEDDEEEDSIAEEAAALGLGAASAPLAREAKKLVPVARKGLAAAAPYIKEIPGIAATPVGAGVIAGGYAASRKAADIMQANPQLREAYADNPMLGAMDPEGAMAAAILREAKGSPERVQRAADQRAAQAAAAPAAPYSNEGRRGMGAPSIGSTNPNPPLPPAAVAPAAPAALANPEADALEKMISGRARPAGGARPAGAAPAGLPGAIPVDPRLEKMMGMDPEARQKQVMQEMQGLAPDTSGYDRMIAEYEKRKQQLEGPKPGFEGLMEYLQQVAEAGPQRTIGEAGTKGAAGLKALQKERAQQQFDLTKEQISLADKKNEATRAFKMDVFKTGQDVYNKVYEQTLSALKEKGQNDRQASANATQLATNAATVAEQARGHTLQAQAELARLKTAERRADKDEAALSLKSLSEAAKELGALLKDPAYSTTKEADVTRAQLNQITAEIAKRGGIKDMGFSTTPTAPVAGKLK